LVDGLLAVTDIIDLGPVGQLLNGDSGGLAGGLTAGLEIGLEYGNEVSAQGVLGSVGGTVGGLVGFINGTIVNLDEVFGADEAASSSADYML
jgi:hypothetical protein